MHDQDIHWRQHFKHFQMALLQLTKGVELSRERQLSDIEQQGVIKAFEFTHELAWNVMKDYFEYQGNTSIMGSRDASRLAFERNMITDGEGWMEMIKSRNMTSHTYNQEIADEIAEKVTSRYCLLFLEFSAKVQELLDGN